MKKLLFSVTVIAFTFIYSSLSYSQTNETLPNVLTFEFSFGDDNLPDEYLLARPGSMIINDDGNIIIGDESSLKVYDNKGRPLKIVGERGQGPNEFEQIGTITISGDGFITARAGRGYLNIYDGKLNFLQKIFYSDPERSKIINEEYNTGMFIPGKVYTLKDDIKIVHINGRDYTGEVISLADHGKHLLLKDDERKLEKIADYRKKSYLSARSGNGAIQTIIPFQGYFLLEALPNNRYIYTHPSVDKFFRDGKDHYQLNIYNLNTNEYSMISRIYDKIDIPESSLDHLLEEPTGPFKEAAKEAHRKAYDHVKKYMYYPPIKNIRTDGNFIFAFTYSTNDNEEILTDIFDGSTGKFLQSAYFSVIPRYIKDGKAYFIKRGQDIFPRVEVYKIDPRVYES